MVVSMQVNHCVCVTDFFIVLNQLEDLCKTTEAERQSMVMEQERHQSMVNLTITSSAKVLVHAEAFNLFSLVV